MWEQHHDDDHDDDDDDVDKDDDGDDDDDDEEEEEEDEDDEDDDDDNPFLMPGCPVPSWEVPAGVQLHRRRWRKLQLMQQPFEFASPRPMSGGFVEGTNGDFWSATCIQLPFCVTIF